MLSFAQPAVAADYEFCANLGGYAKTAMELRQLGQSQYQTQALISADGTLRTLLIKVLELVYTVPVSTSPYAVQDIVTQTCLKNT